MLFRTTNQSSWAPRNWVALRQTIWRKNSPMPLNLCSPCAYLLLMKTRSSSHLWKPNRPKQVPVLLRFLQQANFCLKRWGKETVKIKIRRELEIRKCHPHRCIPQTKKHSGFSEKSSPLFQMNKIEEQAPKCRSNRLSVLLNQFPFNRSPAHLNFQRKERLSKLINSTKSMRCTFKIVGFLSCLWMTPNGINCQSRRANTDIISLILTPQHLNCQKGMAAKWILIVRWQRTSPISLFTQDLCMAISSRALIIWEAMLNPKELKCRRIVVFLVMSETTMLQHRWTTSIPLQRCPTEPQCKRASHLWKPQKN